MTTESKKMRADTVSNATESSTTPLSRRHNTKKHYYLSPQPADIPDSFCLTKPIYVDRKIESLAVEAAVAIVINGIHYAVLMASPTQLEYLAIGFLFSEGLIEHSNELLDWEVTHLCDEAKSNAFHDDNGENYKQKELLNQDVRFEHLLDYDAYVVELVLNQRSFHRIQAQQRQLAGRTGCGMCGITGLNQALPDLSRYLKDTAQTKVTAPSLDNLIAIRAQVETLQHTHQLTGAVHAAATVHDNQLNLFEDVGRHNALDKLIGWQLRHNIEVDCVVMTSRVSIELVQKSIRMRLPWLVGMSAPTSTAVRVAQRYGLGLAGFLRDNRVTYYSGS